MNAEKKIKGWNSMDWSERNYFGIYIRRCLASGQT